MRSNCASSRQKRSTRPAPAGQQAKHEVQRKSNGALTMLWKNRNPERKQQIRKQSRDERHKAERSTRNNLTQRTAERNPGMRVMMWDG